MSKGVCIIKGSRHGLSLQIPHELEFAEVISQLRMRLASAQQFFAGATISLAEETRSLEPAEKEELKRTAQEFGMLLKPQSKQKKSPANNVADTPDLSDRMISEDDNTMLLRRTVRSGQKIRFEGNVVIVGDVNPGAEIVCSGDILVLGSLRGVAHAGCNGNALATVLAFNLQPTQLRIAQYIARSPDEEVPSPVGPEVASVKENVIQISAY